MFLTKDNRLSRRAMIGSLASIAVPSSAKASPDSKLQAIAFDAFPIFDPRSITARARSLFPDKGDALASLWMNKLFGYTWLITSAGRYVDFATLADAALSFAAESVKLEVSREDRSALLATFSRLEVWPDVAPALERLRQRGLRLVFLSNLGEATLVESMANAGLTSLFEPPLSTDRVRQFKPAPVAYHMAMEALHLPKEAIGFAAFGGWDAAGATWFGYRTAWINRLGVPSERLDSVPQIVSRDMDGVLKLAGL